MPSQSAPQSEPISPKTIQTSISPLETLRQIYILLTCTPPTTPSGIQSGPQSTNARTEKSPSRNHTGSSMGSFLRPRHPFFNTLPSGEENLRRSTTRQYKPCAALTFPPIAPNSARRPQYVEKTPLTKTGTGSEPGNLNLTNTLRREVPVPLFARRLTTHHEQPRH